MFRSKALRDTANKAPCMFEFAGVCNRNWDTTVWVHSDQQIHGKGGSEKAHDCFGAFGCSACHEHLPKLSAKKREEAMSRARDRTLLYLFTLGILIVTGKPWRAPVPALMKEKQKFSESTAKPSKAVSREPPAWRRG